MDPLAAGDAVKVTVMTKPDTPRGDQASEETERRGTVERRSAVERRSGLERRRGPGRRRSDSRRSAEEGEMSSEQLEFVLAMDEYKRANRRPFPTWTEVLEVIKYLGYRKVAPMGDHVDRPAPDHSRG